MEQDWKSIVISDFSLGLSEKYWLTNRENMAGKNGEHVTGSMNPFIYPGYLSHGSSSHTALTNVGSLDSNRVARFISVDDNVIDTSTGTSIYAGNGNKLQAINPTTNTIQNAGSWPHTVNAGASTHSGHTSEVIDDVVEYQINGSRRVFYFYRDSVDGDAGTWDGSSFTSDDANEAVFSTATSGFALNKSFPIIPVAADNSFMYIANGNVIHKFDGTTDGGANGTVTANVVKLSVSRTIVDMADGLGKIWIATKPAYSSSTTPTITTGPIRDISIVVWNRQSTIVSMDDDIKINDCTDIYNIFFHKSIPWCFTIGANEVVQLRKYDGRKFVVVREVGRTTVGRPANRGAIQSFNNGILWQDVGGRKFWYGTITDTLSNDFTANADDQLFMVGRSETLATDTAGAIFRKNSNDFYVNFSVSGSESVMIWSPLDRAANLSGAQFSIPFVQLPQNAVVHGIKLLFMEFSGGTGSTTIYVYKNSVGSEAGEFQLTYATDGPKGYLWMPLKWRDTNRILFQFDPSISQTISTTMRLYRVEVYYTPVSKVQ